MCYDFWMKTAVLSPEALEKKLRKNEADRLRQQATRAAEKAARLAAGGEGIVESSPANSQNPGVQQAVPHKMVGKFKVPAAWCPLPKSAARDVEMEWAYQNHLFLIEYTESGAAKLIREGLMNPEVDPAPSRGALSLLRHAAANNTGFFNKIIAGRDRDDSDEARAARRHIRRQREQVIEALKQFQK